MLLRTFSFLMTVLLKTRRAAFFGFLPPCRPSSVLLARARNNKHQFPVPLPADPHFPHSVHISQFSLYFEYHGPPTILDNVVSLALSTLPNDATKYKYTQQQLLALGSIWMFSPPPPLPTLPPPPLRLTHSTSSSTTAAPKSYLRIHFDPRRFTSAFNQLTTNWHSSKSLIAENSSLGYLAIHKPRKLPVHATVDNAVENVLSGVKAAHNLSYLGLPHRLDVETEGVLVLSTKIGFQQYFSKLLARKTEGVANGVVKIYEALLVGTKAELLECLDSPATPYDSATNILTHFLVKSDRAPKLFNREQNTTDEQEARLRIVEIGEDCEKGVPVRLELLTGRTHQIRGQFCAIGFPVVNDDMYGGGGGGEGDYLALLCKSISFPKPHVNVVKNVKRIKRYDQNENRVTEREEIEKEEKFSIGSEVVKIETAGIIGCEFI